MPGCYFRRLIGVGICPAFPEGAAAGFRRQSGFSKGRVKMAEQSVKTGGDPVHFLDIRREFPAPVFPVEPAGRSGWRNGMAVRMPNHLGDAVMTYARNTKIPLENPGAGVGLNSADDEYWRQNLGVMYMSHGTTTNVWYPDGAAATVGYNAAKQIRRCESSKFVPMFNDYTYL